MQTAGDTPPLGTHSLVLAQGVLGTQQNHPSAVGAPILPARGGPRPTSSSVCRKWGRN